MTDKNREIDEIKQVLIKCHKRVRTQQEDYMQDNYAKAILWHYREQKCFRYFLKKIKKSFEKRVDICVVMVYNVVTEQEKIL